jgi:hypothetical protein
MNLHRTDDYSFVQYNHPPYAHCSMIQVYIYGKDAIRLGMATQIGSNATAMAQQQQQ